MNMLELVEAISDKGMGVVAFALCCWITIYIVRKLSVAIDKLVSRMERFTDRVRDEHERSSKQHEKLMDQHENITKSLNETAITLGRINGYKE